MTKLEVEKAAEYLDDRAHEILDRAKAVIVAGGSTTEIADELARIRSHLELSELLIKLAVRTP